MNSYGRQLMVVKNDVGSLEFKILNDDPDAAALGASAERIDMTVTDDLTGDALLVISGRIGGWNVARSTPGEESSNETTISVPGTLATLADAVVYAHPGLDALRNDSDTRYFNFACLDYTDWLTWDAAFERNTWAAGDGFPVNWPDPTAILIWGNEFAPIGPCYFRTEITTEAAMHTLYITADDTWVAFIDGVEVGRSDKFYGLAETFAIDRELAAGTHSVGIFATNQYAGSAWVLCAIYQRGYFADVLVAHTDDTWKTLGYPATPPGMTPGEIMAVLIDEARARGGLTVAGIPWDYDFDGDDDSNGDPWAAEIEIGFRIGGETILDALRKLAETTVDFAAVAGDPVLRMVNKGGLDTTPGVTIEEAVHIEGPLELSGEVGGRGVLLVRDATGEYREVDSLLAGDRRESFLDAGSAPSAEAADQMAVGALLATAPGPVTVQVAITSITGAVPFKDFNVGDTIQLPDRDGDLVDTEVLSIGAVDVEDDQAGDDFTVYLITGVQAGSATDPDDLFAPDPLPDAGDGSAVLMDLAF